MARTFYEFFAGGGMARLGLGDGWRCLFANDVDPAKAAAYRENFPPADELILADVASLSSAELPGRADLAWASFPCQDLSLAGQGAGLAGARSGTFWPFWRLIEALAREGRAPRIVALENVCGALTSHGGRDFAALAGALAPLYRFGALVVDAALFLPQSRPRLFILGVSEDIAVAHAEADPDWHPRALVEAVGRLEPKIAARWAWWRPATPARRNAQFADLMEAEPGDVRWHEDAATARLLALMAPLHLARVREAQASGRPLVGALYRRTRMEGGFRKQRAEIRFDGLAGCLRTPAGGSSRQSLIAVSGETIRSRLLSAREAARLMGVPDDYRLPANYNAAYRLAGDGVAVPVVRHLAARLIEPMLDARPALAAE